MANGGGTSGGGGKDVLVQEMVIPSRAEGRLTAKSGDPAPSGEGAFGNILYYTPYVGNHISLFIRGQWQDYTFPELQISTVNLTDVTPYDVYIVDPGDGELVLEFSPAWPSLTTPPARDRQDGILVKGGDATRRLLGSVGATAGPDTPGGLGTVWDVMEARLISNLYNAIPRPMLVCAGYTDDDNRTPENVFTPGGTWTSPLWGSGVPNYNAFCACVPRTLVTRAQVNMENSTCTTYGAGIGIAAGDENYDPTAIQVEVISSDAQINATLNTVNIVNMGFGVTYIAFVGVGGTGAFTVYPNGNKHGATHAPKTTFITSWIDN